MLVQIVLSLFGPASILLRGQNDHFKVVPLLQEELSKLSVHGLVNRASLTTGLVITIVICLPVTRKSLLFIYCHVSCDDRSFVTRRGKVFVSLVEVLALRKLQLEVRYEISV